MKRDQIIALDIVRFSAAMLVVLYHLTYWISSPVPSTPNRVSGGVFDFGSAGLSFGWIGVQIFFVLSGFVIAYSASGSSAFSFFRSRVLRLAPAAWICATITLCIAALVNDGSLIQLSVRYLKSISFFPIGDWIDGTYWTLGVEISFYAIVLALLLAKRLPLLEYAMGLVASVSATFWILALLEPDVGEFMNGRLAALILLRHGCEFSVGVTLWLILMNRGTYFRYATLIVGVAGGLIEIYFVASEHNYTNRPLLFIGTPSLTWLGSLAVIYAAVRWNPLVQTLVGPQGAKIARSVGLITYPLYLLHQLAGAALMGALWRLGLSQGACLGLSIFAMLLISAAVALWLEPQLSKPTRAIIERAQTVSASWLKRA